MLPSLGAQRPALEPGLGWDFCFREDVAFGVQNLDGKGFWSFWVWPTGKPPVPLCPGKWLSCWSHSISDG